MSDQPTVQWLPIEPSAQALEFMAHQEEVVRQICSVFAITPQELGAVGNPSAMEQEAARRDTERYLKRAIISVLRERRTQSHENTENTNQD